MPEKNRILSVEDDPVMAAMIFTLLDGAGYEVAHFTEANSALEWLKSNSVDLVITDIGLPGISGIQFCKFLRSDPATASLPVIMLTAMDDERHKVGSLKTGADDYVVKPFSNPELLARVEALLRRCYHSGRTDKVLADGPLSVDDDAGEVFLDGEQVSLVPKEYALLVLFLRNRGHILSFDSIAEHVWGRDVIATRDTIKVTVSRLRLKLGDYGAAHIEPVTGTGYKWVEK